jgi:hypothetical protein
MTPINTLFLKKVRIFTVNGMEQRETSTFVLSAYDTLHVEK